MVKIKILDFCFTVPTLKAINSTFFPEPLFRSSSNLSSYEDNFNKLFATSAQIVDKEVNILYNNKI